MTDPHAPLRYALASQYHSALAMLGEAIERCPDDLWLDPGPANAYWQIAYHSLFFTHLYLQVDDDAFRPWEHHQAEVQYPDGIPGPPDPDDPRPVGPEPYPRERLLEYWRICDGMVDGALKEMDLASPESGFHWYPIPKLEHQLVNIRHIQHHGAQLADRLRATRDIGIDWVGARRS